jgi:hypothetical protein
MADDRPKKLDLMDWMNPKGDDFLGSGMNMHEWVTANGIADYKMSWSNQDRKEQQRRLQFVIDMTLEMRRMQQEYGEQHNGTWYVASGMVFRMGIEAVITGRRRDLVAAIDMCSVDGFKWNYDNEQGAIWGERYAPFHTLCQQCLDTWATDKETAQA